jgi:hypothetical protein
MPQNYTKKKGDRCFADPKKYLFNIDTLWLNIDSFHYDEIMDLGLRDLLIEGRTHMSDHGECLPIPIQLEGYDNDVIFEVMGAQPPQYQYSIRNESMAIYFSKNQREKGSSMKIQINQFVLWEKGVEKAYAEALEVLKSFGFMPHSAKLNRIDFACHSDQFTWNLSDFKKFEYPRNIKDDNKPNFFKVDVTTGAFETVYYGSRDRLALRIYDKSKEIKDKNKQYFYEIYRQHDMDINKIWNVELEVRRPFLKDLKNDDASFDSVYDDFDKCLEEDGLSRLWSLLMDRYSHDSQHWTTLKKGDKQKFKQIEQYNLKIEKDIDSNFDREVAQIAGRLMTGVLADEDYSLDNAIKKFKEKLFDMERDEKRKAWLVLVEKKKSMIHSNVINKTIASDAKLNREKEVQLITNEIIRQVELEHKNKTIKKDFPNEEKPNTQN